HSASPLLRILAMVENLGRKLTTIFVLLAISIGLLTLKSPPLNMGLDLQGGTQIVLSVDFDKALAEGKISEADYNDKVGLLNQMIAIFRQRIDPTGTREPSITTQGNDRIIIEMPGSTLGDRKAVASMVGGLALDGDAIGLGEGGNDFPAGGGMIKVGEEEIRYGRVQDITEDRMTEGADGVAKMVKVTVGKRLVGLTRGENQTTVAAHSEGDTVKLTSTNEIRNAIENLGNLAFVIEAEATDFTATNTDLLSERAKLSTWLTDNPGKAVTDFNSVATQNGGSDAKIQWFSRKDNPDAPSSGLDRAVAILNMPALDREDWVFTGEALEQAYMSQDSLGLPAVGFQMVPQRVGDFTDFTEEHINRSLAIILNGEIVTSANIGGVLPGSGQIYGSFTAEYVQNMITVLRTGSLSIKPSIESENRVSANLGADYVRKAFISSGIALLGVMIFMIYYYRRFGVYASIALTSTLVMLLGAMSFLDATLTLPGVAGIILTVGMAVDANILIFDRVREEMDKGRNIKQAAKNGFSRAAVTIFDANITTLLTAVVLYNVGTGPVKGFAVTLMVGVLTSMFSALVISKVLVHKALEGGLKEMNIGTWLVTADYGFMNKAKKAAVGSIIAIIAGLTLFISIPDKDKLGIEFIGGATMQVRTAEPADLEEVRKLVSAIGGDISGSTVTGVSSEAASDDTFSMFRITFKTDSDQTGDDAGASFKNLINEALKDVLLTDPIIATVGADNQAEVDMHFVDNHEVEEVVAVLEGVGIKDPIVTKGLGVGAYMATGTVSSGQNEDALAVSLLAAFGAAVSEVPFTMIDSGADYSQVGSQVVGEMRDKAIMAILISLFAIVMYIRVRFSEYSYGIAAVVAVVHDVLITLGVLSIFIVTGFIHVEITVAMIAAFLTIIGYSLNDTIVLFDRVRENLPRMETDLGTILNTSINQTLSRTVLTSVTTLLAVVILLVFNFGTGNVLESFAVTMVIGVGVGTYSSMFIASPVLLFLENRSAAKRQAVRDSLGKAEIVTGK
ncbi:MAG: SecD/SecF fusion protein, partial [Planctomycetota bacterium]